MTLTFIVLAGGCTSGARRTVQAASGVTTTTPGQGDTVLFDPTTETEETPTSDGTETLVTESEQECLSNGSSTQTECWSESSSEEAVFRTILASYHGLTECVDLANQMEPSPTASQQQVRAAFELGALVIARCARRIVAMQMNGPVGQQHVGALSHNDYLLWQIVQSMTQGQ